MVRVESTGVIRVFRSASGIWAAPMIKLFATLASVIVLVGCIATATNPKARFEVRATESAQRQILDATAAFGEANGFRVARSNGMQRDGRAVSQLDLHRSDGISVAMDSFLSRDTLSVSIFSVAKRANWIEVRHSLFRDISGATGEQIEIVEVSAGTR